MLPLSLNPYWGCRPMTQQHLKFGKKIKFANVDYQSTQISFWDNRGLYK
jgi:hypothetical protein